MAYNLPSVRGGTRTTATTTRWTNSVNTRKFVWRREQKVSRRKMTRSWAPWTTKTTRCNVKLVSCFWMGHWVFWHNSRPKRTRSWARPKMTRSWAPWTTTKTTRCYVKLVSGFWMGHSVFWHLWYHSSACGGVWQHASRWRIWRELRGHIVPREDIKRIWRELRGHIVHREDIKQHRSFIF